MSESHSTVEYRDVPGFPGYRVGSDGTVWSCRVTGSHFSAPGKTWHLLRGCYDHDGYKLFSPRRDGKNHTLRVARIVLLAFVGPPPLPGMEAAHENGIRADNRLVNLRWATHVGNEADKQRHGTLPAGEKNPMAKLTVPRVIDIKRRLLAGESQSRIAVWHKVSQNTISRINLGESWKEVIVPPVAIPQATE